MPVHDWKRVDAGLFHHFHQRWIVDLCDWFISCELPAGHYALIERSDGNAFRQADLMRPTTRLTMEAEARLYTAKANRISIRHPLGDTVAVLEIVSPGNKSSRDGLYSFVRKSLDLLNQGIHLLIVDLLPPTKRDPQGIHGAIWEEVCDEPFELPADKPLTLVSYSAGPPKEAFVEPIAVGDVLPPMPLFLAASMHIPVPLEETYCRTWSLCPEPMRELVESVASGQGE